MFLLSPRVTCAPYFRLLVICNYHNRSDLMKLMISCLDFAHDVKSRVILGKVLTSADSKMRLYATKHMRVLLRSKMPFFNSWGLEMLIYQVKYMYMYVCRKPRYRISSKNSALLIVIWHLYRMIENSL